MISKAEKKLPRGKVALSIVPSLTPQGSSNYRHESFFSDTLTKWTDISIRLKFIRLCILEKKIEASLEN